MQSDAQPGRITMDGPALAIGVLSVTACVLFVGLVLLAPFPVAPAYGIGQLDRGGDYVMLTQQLSNSQEGVLVVDAAAQRMSLYAFDVNQKRLRALHLNIPLEQLPGVKEKLETGQP